MGRIFGILLFVLALWFVGQMLLGAREPSDDRDLPYRELRVGTQRPAEAPA